MKIAISLCLSMTLASVFVGCNGGDSSQNDTSNVVTVERGAVLEAEVKDASGQIAKVTQFNNYKFDNEIKYPISVTGGFIDVDDSGDKNQGDIPLTFPLKADFGKNITLITTAISDSSQEVRTQRLDAMARDLNISKDELLKLPSESFDSSILSNELFKVLKENNTTDLTQIVTNLTSHPIITNFKTKKDSVDTTKDKKEFAINLEKEYVENLAQTGKVTKIEYEDIKNTLTNKAFELSIFHVNDVHSHITSEDLSYTINGVSKKVQTGGYARIATKLNELKTAKPNSLTLNAGDAFQGTLYYSLFKGEADATAMNLIPWDAYTLGNHEFDDGDIGLKSFLDRLDKKIPVVSANVVPSSTNILKDYWKPYIIKDINGQKVGIIGIDTASKTKNSSNPSSEITFLNEVETAQKYIDEINGKGVDKIVLLTHQGLNNDLSMAKKLTGVDVIIGGDSHTLMGDFSNIGLKSVTNSYPLQAKAKDNKKVCIAHAWEYAHILGNLDVVFNDKGEVIACDGKPLLLVNEDLNVTNKNIAVTAENSMAVAAIKSFENQVATKKATQIGISSQKLGHNRIPGDKQDGVSILPLGSDIAPIVAKSFYDLSNLADACIQNGGGVRVAVESGKITLGDAYTLLPFANTLFEIKMTGKEIKQVLEDALNATYAIGGSTGSFPYSYGLRYDIDASLSDNNRISNLEIKDRKTGVWGNIEADKMYTIVTNSFTAGGKDGYLTFKTVQDKRGAGVDTYLDYAMSYVKYVENKTLKGENITKLPNEDHPIKSYKNKLGEAIKFEISDIKKITNYESTKVAGSEIVAYDEVSKKIFVTNGAENKIDILQLSYDKATNISTSNKVSSIDLGTYGASVQSVAVKNEKVAVALGSANKAQIKGSVVIFDTTGNHIKTVEAGYLPDMVTFNESGSKIVVANEGEPDANYVDPIGSVGIIDVANNYAYSDVAFESVTIPENVIIKKGSNASVDLEPEYITVKNDIAYVTLQENNALAIVDLNTKNVSVKALGFKDYSQDSNSLDIEEDGIIEFKTYKNLYGMYMPDSIASYNVASSTYLVTANEGDGREWGSYVNDAKISKLLKDSKLSDELKAIYTGEKNDLKVHTELGLVNGKYEKLYTFGGRSFSIWDNNGALVFDSKNELEKLTQTNMPALFNQEDGVLDGRSGNKGVEPEALAIGEIQGSVFAFVGLERQNAIVVFDITNPSNVKFSTYIQTKDNGGTSPEGMKFVSASNSPTGNPLLMVAYEVSGSTAVYEIK